MVASVINVVFKIFLDLPLLFFCFIFAPPLKFLRLIFQGKNKKIAFILRFYEYSI